MSNFSINSYIVPVQDYNNISGVNHGVNTVATQISQVNNSISNDVVEFTGKPDNKASGTFADKKFTIECSDGLTKRHLSGAIDNIDFNIKHNGKFLSADTLTGNIGDKELNLKVKEGLFTKNIRGDIGGSPVDLKVSDTWSGYKIKGNFKGKEVDIKLNSKFVGYSLESDNMSLRIKNKTLFGNDVNVNGTYKEDPDLIPILMDMVYCLNDEQIMMALCL